VKKIFKGATGWILWIIKREMNLFELCGSEMADDMHDQHDMALAY
jgi:hypothetical protein